jgi:hypothetical protein
MKGPYAPPHKPVKRLRGNARRWEIVAADGIFPRFIPEYIPDDAIDDKIEEVWYGEGYDKRNFRL